jgi:sugar/nucleoside kinase (ribokinase family)
MTPSPLPQGAGKRLGGSSNYFSLAASLYTKVRVVGVVGEDYSAQDRALLEDRGVDLSGVQVQKGRTFAWKGEYSGDLNEAKTLQTDLNVFEHFNPTLPDSYKDTPYVFLANIDPVLQLQVLEQVNSPLLVGSDTMNFWIHSKKADLLKVLKRIDVLLINEQEAKMLTGEPNAIAAAKAATELGPKSVVIKRGEYGFVLFTPGEGYFILPAYPIAHVVDPTGAGDSFAGAFFGYMAQAGKGYDLEALKKACLHGCLVASFTVQDFGTAALAHTSKEKLEERLKGYRKVVLL